MTGFAFAENRVFELRIYTANEGKLEALKAWASATTPRRFLKKHHMEVVALLDTAERRSEGQGYVYLHLYAHPSREAATKNWAEFQADPEWQKAKQGK